MATSAENGGPDTGALGLADLVGRELAPKPWAEGENIPWNEPAFSERMLREHLSQDHHLASRRSEKIADHVEWIHGTLLGGRASRVLDLTCGPGLYSNALARLGHSCTGIDWSPASIAHARAEAERDGLTSRFELADVRTAEYGTGYDAVLLIFGEFNVFRPDRLEAMLTRACAALRPGAVLAIEPQKYDAVRQNGQLAATWYAAGSGLFSDRPHLCLSEHFWDDEAKASTVRYYIIDTATGAVTRSCLSCRAYTHDDLRGLLSRCGFDEVTFRPSLTGRADRSQSQLEVVTARRPA